MSFDSRFGVGLSELMRLLENENERDGLIVGVGLFDINFFIITRVSLERSFKANEVWICSGTIIYYIISASL